MTQSPLTTATILGYSGHTEGSNGQITRVVVHATVSPCQRGEARNVAGYFQSQQSGGLAHYVVDPGEIICCADEGLATWGAPPNHGEIHVELCDPQAGDPARWNDANHYSTLVLGAHLVADICRRQGVPMQRLTTAQVAAGQRGICGHGNVSDAFHQSDHQDPDVAGPFPWDAFMRLVTAGTPALPPETHNMDDGTFIRWAYVFWLGRPVDPTGYATYRQYLATNPTAGREQMCAALLASDEGQRHQAILIAQANEVAARNNIK